MKEKGTEKPVEKATEAIAGFLKHVGGKKASADTPKATDGSQDSEKAKGAFGKNGGGGAF